MVDLVVILCSVMLFWNQSRESQKLMTKLQMYKLIGHTLSYTWCGRFESVHIITLHCHALTYPYAVKMPPQWNLARWNLAKKLEKKMLFNFTTIDVALYPVLKFPVFNYRLTYRQTQRDRWIVTCNKILLLCPFFHSSMAW